MSDKERISNQLKIGAIIIIIVVLCCIAFNLKGIDEKLDRLETIDRVDSIMKNVIRLNLSAAESEARLDKLEFYSQPEETAEIILHDYYETLNVIIFGDDVGRLSWEDGKMSFEGNTHESAKLFFEYLKGYVDNYIDSEMEELRK